MYLKAPTYLYHAELAPTGRLFQGDEDRPLRHPGEGWQDSPEGFAEAAAPSADDVLAANTAAADARAEIAILKSDRAEALDRAEEAEKTALEAMEALDAEKAAHAATKAALSAAQAAEVAADSRTADMAKARDEAKARVTELEADLNGAIERGQAALAKAEAKAAKT